MLSHPFRQMIGFRLIRAISFVHAQTGNSSEVAIGELMRRHVSGPASDLKWSAVALVRIGERLRAGNEPDAPALHGIIATLQREVGRPSSIVDELSAG